MNQFLLEPGSFRDRNGRIFYREGAVYRALNQKALEEWNRLLQTQFFQSFSQAGRIVSTEQVSLEIAPDLEKEWAGLLRHERIPFISYPYEWSFGMLRDAALLQLDLILAGLKEDIIPKDASAYNVQWRGAQPVFIDVASFEKLEAGEPWAGYRQFCQLFLYPLFLQAYRGLPFHPWLRGSIDGIEAGHCWAVMCWRDLLRAGVLSHVYLQFKLQARYAGLDRDVKGQLKTAGFNKDLIRANVSKLRRTVSGLSWDPPRSVWSEYVSEHSYSQSDQARKQAFVEAAAAQAAPGLVWDLGCNTGAYSKLAAKHAGYVVAMDADHLAVERLYRELSQAGETRILPLLNNLADPSPGLGWRGRERKSLQQRHRPDLVLALALIHHLVIGVNVPLDEFIEWLSELGAWVVIEFVSKEDAMVQTLLRNKPDQYWDYHQEYFEQQLHRRFELVRQETLESATRTLYFARPR